MLWQRFGSYLRFKNGDFASQKFAFYYKSAHVLKILGKDYESANGILEIYMDSLPIASLSFEGADFETKEVSLPAYENIHNIGFKYKKVMRVQC